MSAFAQQTVTSASIKGRVEDSNGATVVWAHVTTTNVDRNQVWHTTSDEEGRYSFLYLPGRS